jgi:hypothetical protein
VKRGIFPPMTSIERTAYSRFRRAPMVRELRKIYTPTLTDVAFVATTTRGQAQKFGLVKYSRLFLFSLQQMARPILHQ